MTDGQFAELIQREHETPEVEFKPAGPLSDARLSVLVIRAIMGMANREGGGFIVVGVSDVKGVLDPVGMTAADHDSWTHDALMGKLEGYADPRVELAFSKHRWNGRSFVALMVSEFDEMPILCKKNSPDPQHLLRDGLCYVRGRQKPETIGISSHADMRALLDLATRKAMARPVKWQGAGRSPVAAEDDEQQFNAQAGLLQAAGGIFARVEGRGHWRLMIRPRAFRAGRVPEVLDLREILRACRVTIGGWTAPPMGREENMEIGMDWIGETVERGSRLEGWRFFQSGLLVHWASIPQDWPPGGAPPEAGSDRVLGIHDALYRHTVAFDLAARLSRTVAGDADMTVETEVCGLHARQLIVDVDGRFPLPREFRANGVLSFPRKIAASRAELAAARRQLALEGARQLFQRFGWAAPVETLREVQEGL